MGVVGRKIRPSFDIWFLYCILSPERCATPLRMYAANEQQIWALDTRCSVSTALSHRHGMFLRKGRGSDTPIQIQISPPVCELWRPENKHAPLLSTHSHEQHSWLREDREEQWVGALFTFTTQLAGHTLPKRCKQRSTVTVKQKLLTPGDGKNLDDEPEHHNRSWAAPPHTHTQKNLQGNLCPKQKKSQWPNAGSENSGQKAITCSAWEPCVWKASVVGSVNEPGLLQNRLKLGFKFLILSNGPT